MIWKKSSRCVTNNHCVEVAANWRRRKRWRKSTYSSDTANCVEVATDRLVHVRDSKDADGPHLTFDRDAWSAFLGMVRPGRND